MSPAADGGRHDREMRLDPKALPHRFTYDTGLDGAAAEAAVLLDRERIRICRTLPSGIPMVMQLPLAAFEGVAIRFEASPGYTPDGLRAVLELRHTDPHLSVPLGFADDVRDMIADWRAWARVLALPLLVTEADDSLTTVESRIGAVEATPAKPRRRRSVLAQRRPRFLVRRRTGVLPEVPEIVGGREIFAWE
jgi:hypothetical protein